MSKITFRADDALVERLETLELSKSEAMREALRAYLDDGGPTRGADRERRPDAGQSGAIDELVRDRVDELLADRLDELGLESAAERREKPPRDRSAPGAVTVTVSLEDEHPDSTRSTRGRSRQRDEQPHRRGQEQESVRQEPAEENRATGDADTDCQRSIDGTRTQCDQCGECVDDDHVYCPNCGEKTSRRLFCECGDEIRSDWSFCPGCGRRTPAADVLGRDSHT
ncbi:ribbon-helix-helix protein, CopG family [Natronorubrum thiooxidans]|uniref:CdrL-like middle region domain-containing protein n=1 Tax=Natronorubrum thiooxidans TaxID=308853 RepID=A0A1N7C2Z8_9EURY|nr:ribbon-helix-helix protein, CopG family [Natronorubrum thiooxidans]SIR57968.1 hypothetical protein SAMN05421752_10187 [Natronorubrum thiooxidans]